MSLAPPIRRTADPAGPSRASAPGGLPSRRALLTAVSPALLVAVTAVAVLHHFSVPYGRILVFAAYLACGVTLPGTLLWRLLHGRPGHIAEDLAAGTALGYALEVLGYVPARWAGLPLAFLAWPAVTLIAFASVPRLRRHWRGSGLRAPVTWSWSVAALLTVLLTACGAMVFRTTPLRVAGVSSGHVDLAYHLALAGELRHHVPPTAPWVHGEPLHYHWFVYADMAATGWATGIDAETLLLRLSMPPMMICFAVLLAATARRLSGRWWTGPAALVVNYLAIAPTPARWALSFAPFHQAQLSPFMWLSPTQTFGAVLFAALVLPVTELLRGRRGPGTAPAHGTRALWLCTALLIAVVMGAKATFLPLLLAGLLTVAVAVAAARRRVPAEVALLIGLVLAFMAFAQFVLFGGTSLGDAVTPGTTLRILAAKILRHGAPEPFVLGVPLIVLVAGWGCLWAGTAGLLRRPRAVADPAVVLLLGMGAAGIVAMLVLWEPGMSQFYFHRSATPYLAVAAMCGLAAVLPARPSWAHGAALAAAAGGGAAVAVMADRAWRLVGGGGGPSVRAVLPPFLAMPAVVLCGAGIAVLLRRSRTGARSPVFRSRIGARRRPLIAAMVIVACTGLALPASAERQTVIWRWPAAPAYRTVGPPQADPGGVAAARWLRRHSGPGDLVATNAHCIVVPGGGCDNRHFWISAYAERRVLVEGWGYTEGNNTRAVPAGTRYQYLPFWDQRRLADNDAAFTAPSAAAVARLRDGHGVRWLLADDRAGTVSPALSDFAVPRFHRGSCTVYELTR